ncbi:MAG: tryptophan synthase subunit alpha [Bacteroidia bacterium]|nr:tryptophan synthase subunit alpha [Bacteroidia bacterium]
MTFKQYIINRKRPILNIYFTAGFPGINSMPDILEGLSEAGVDMVEIGIPFSDPVSDGQTIQSSNSTAINNGITTELIFQQLALHNTDIPKVIMGYFNSVLQYGVDEFCEQCALNRIHGVILPDLPPDIYIEKYQQKFLSHGMSAIFLVTPETSDDRIRYIDSLSNAFIYAVSSSSTTGKGTDIRSSEAYLSRLQKMNLDNPVLVGFSIKNKSDYEFVCSYTAGAIIGSAFINNIKDSKNLKEDIKSFVKSIRD